jgi:PAS domain S-box-containing protein
MAYFQKTREALFQSEKNYKNLIENSHDAIYLLYENRFVYVNDKFLEMFKVSKEEVNSPDFNFTGLIAPESREFINNQTKRLENGEELSPQYEFTAMDKNENRLFVEVSVSYIKYEDGYATQGILRDITDRKKAEEDRIKLEEQLFQAQKMESIGRLAGGIAHDFNNILTSIMGYAELLTLKFTDDNTPEGHASNIIVKGSERAANLTQQLLGFARRGKYNPVPFNINDVIRDTVEVWEKIFEKNINISFALHDEINTIEGDKNQINQVLTNIIINAKDAMPNGGDLTFRTENITIDENFTRNYPEFKPGKYVKISIKDTGIGMPKDVKDNIFEPFFSTKGEGKGTGLGLATVYGIVKNHNGHINVNSEPSEGTVFIIYFPVSDKQIIDVIEKEEVIKGEALILVVDDEDDLRDMAGTLLQDLGYKVLMATNGIEAIEIFKDKFNDIDLVILDMIMPEMAGGETFLEMKKINPDVKVVLSSGYSQDGKATEILNDGVKTFIQKPYTMANLSQCISITLNG